MMAQILMKWGGLVITLTALAGLSACAKPVKVYPGPELPKDNVSVIAPLIKSGSHLSELNITRINGIRMADTGSSKYKVKPGTQTLMVELFQEGPSRGAFTASRSINTISFDAEPGHSYKVVGDMYDGNGQVWVVDAESGQKVAQE